jgi:hypothetical protein
MAQTLDRIGVAARKELQAAWSKEEAESAWRSAWWETTLALAEPERRPDIAAALDEAGRILKQARDYLHKRRQVGRTFLEVNLQETRTLPPTLSMEYALAGGSPEDALATIRSAEQRKLSMREFIAELQHRPVPQGAGHEAGPDMVAEAVAGLSPERKAEVVAGALEDEEVADRVVRDRQARASLAKAETKAEREREGTARERYSLAEPRSDQIGANADLQYALTKARSAFEDAAEAADKLAAYGWPDNSREQGAALVQRALAAGEAVKAKLEGRDLDEELAALLDSNGEG